MPRFDVRGVVSLALKMAEIADEFRFKLNEYFPLREPFLDNFRRK